MQRIGFIQKRHRRGFFIIDYDEYFDQINDVLEKTPPGALRRMSVRGMNC